MYNKGNNKITELRTILQRESQNSQVYKQTKSVNNPPSWNDHSVSGYTTVHKYNLQPEKELIIHLSTRR
jgi:hypothetical protein